MLKDIEERLGLRRKVVKPFVRDVDPNLVSVAGLLTAVASAYMLSENFLFTGAVLVLLSGFLDVLDGEIAKEYGTSDLGDLIDHTFDRISDIAILLGLAFNPFVPVYLGTFAIVAVLLVSYMGTQAQALLDQRNYGGLVGRADRMVIITLVSLVAVRYVDALVYGLWFIVLVSVLTFLQRFVYSYRNLRK
ncbi:MAG: CDP-alcohol phosphatidyltransferase family protein [Candidatus Aenigmatarchaeota archaeon]